MKIGDRVIAAGEPPYVIAEIGVNHDGSVDRAIALVDAARDAGADAVKLQLFEAARLLGRDARPAAYQRRAGAADPHEMLARLELAPDALRAVADHARAAGLHAIVSIFSVELVAAARAIAFDAYKVASTDVINRPLIDAMTADGVPLLVSTGAASLDEVRDVTHWLGRHPHVLLHCVSAYPTPDADAALAGRAAMLAVNPNALGYSDHTTSLDTGALAVAGGACVLEKHLTWDRTAAGPDHAASLEPAGLREYVRLARRAWTMLGRAEKTVLDLERDVRAVSRQSLTAARDLPAGLVLERGDLTIKRPGGGLSPARLADVVGRRVARPVPADAPLTAADVADEAPAAAPAVPPAPPARPAAPVTRTIDVVTGSRADFGLLAPVMRAIAAHPALALRVVATGTHLLPPARTIDDVSAAFDVACEIPMQRAGASGRAADADALARGLQGFAARLAQARPDIVLVLGDRIEAFAAAAAASVAGVHVAHLHGGDRAEGIADESLRHAISKLAHVHLPATEQSRDRLVAMGEDAARVHCVGSPAIDGLDAVPPMPAPAFDTLGAPDVMFLLHPTGRDDATERARAARLLDVCRRAGRVLALHPNHDAGRDGIVEAVTATGVASRAHLPRDEFLGLLKRTRVLVGNSSAGLIECAAVPLPCVDVGSRQAGRERPAHVTWCPDDADDGTIARAIAAALEKPLVPFAHPYGDGHTGRRVAAVLATVDADNHPIAKRNTY